MIDIIRDINFEEINHNPFEENEIEKVVVITETQRELWLSCIIGGEPASLAYNESISLNLKGNFSIKAFESAFRKVVKRHESLRSSISGDGENVIIYRDIDFNINFEDLSTKSTTEQEQIIAEFISQEMQTVFDLQSEPLFRVTLHKLALNNYYFTIVIHHIICDGWSFGIILEDLSKIYNANLTGIPANLNQPIQISQYAEEQFAYLKTDEFKKVEGYWFNLYKDSIPTLNFPIDYPRDTNRTYKAKRIDSHLSAELVTSIKKLGAKTGCSLVNTMLSAFEVFLYLKAGNTDVVLGLPASGQSASGNFELVGHCANLLPLRSKINPEFSFPAYLKDRKKYFLDAFDNQRLSFGQLVKKLNFKRDNSRIPLVPIIFNIDMGVDALVSFDGLDYTLISNPREYETFEIFLNATGSQDALTLEWTYNTQLFKETSIKKTIEEFEYLLQTLVEKPELELKNISFGNEIKADISTAVHKNKFSLTEYDLIKLVEETASNFSNKTAISFKNESISFNELQKKSDQLASFINQQNLGLGDVIAVSIDRSMKMLVSIVAIIKSGAAYLPLDPEYPQDRLEFMLEDSAAKMLFISKRHKNRLNTTAKEVIIETIWDELKNYPSVIFKRFDEQSLAYILYTSGSTGKPKGTKISKLNLLNFLLSMKTKPGITAEDKVLAITTICFDISGLELLLPLISGAEVIIADNEAVKDGRILLEQMEQKAITVMQATPSTWQMILDSGWEKPLPIKVLCGGESLSKQLSVKLLHNCTELWNMYGPTETTIWSTSKQIALTDESITIGKPINNTQVYLLDESKNRVSVGKEGEIFIGGLGVAKGYLNRDALTAEKFINDPFSDLPNAKMYGTGDLGILLPNGEFSCMGRIDHQVKIRGYRVELGEIESLLGQQDELSKCVVIAKEFANHDKKLIAFVILKEVGIEILPKELVSKWKEKLQVDLPNYMIPDDFISVKSFPLTANAKIDRNALSQLVLGKVEKTRHSENKSLTVNEEILLKIWSDVLEVEDIKTTDDFFEIGGHSLLAVKVMVAIGKATNKRFPLAILFENPTIEKLAPHLNEDKPEVVLTSLVPIKTTGSRLPIYVVHGMGMNVLSFINLAKSLHNDQPLYGIQAKGLNPGDEPDDNIETIADAYIAEILQQNPEGPFNLVGYSSGGLIVWEMAKKLQKAGKKVGFLGLLDTSTNVNYYNEYLKNGQIGAISKLILKDIGANFRFLTQYPKEYLNFKKNFVLGTLYNTYKLIKPNKKDLNNPHYLVERTHKAHEKAFRQYKHLEYDGPVHLFKASEKPMTYMPDESTNGWAPYVKGTLTISKLPFDHLSFFSSKGVAAFAQELTDALENAKKE